MDNVKMQTISDILNSDIDFAKELIAMEPSDAVTALKSKGHNVTEEELLEFVAECKKSFSETDELDAKELDDVAGGCAKCFGIGIGIGIALVAAPW